MTETATTETVPNVETVRAKAAQYNNWGTWGPDDQLGSLNYVTPAKVAAAARLARTGKVFSLALPLDDTGPQTGSFGRYNPLHHMLWDGGDIAAGAQDHLAEVRYTDDAAYIILQSSTQWDALAHIFHDGKMYNGYGTEQVTSRGAAKGDICNAKDKMIGRGVLLDVPRWKGKPWLEPGEAISDADLEATAEAHGVEVGEGDFVLVRTGQIAQRRSMGSWGDYSGGPAPGLGDERGRLLLPAQGGHRVHRHLGHRGTAQRDARRVPAAAHHHAGQRRDPARRDLGSGGPGRRLRGRRGLRVPAGRAAADDHRGGRYAGQPAGRQMRPAPFRYRRATSLEEAVAELAAAGGRARVLAGGQTLVAELNARLVSPEVLVDLGSVPGLDQLEIDAEQVRIGAMRRLATLEHDPRLAEALPALVEAAARIAYPAVRNRGTIGGNVAHADPASGIPPVLLAHDGEVVLTGPGGTRTVPAAEFFTGYRRTATAPDEIVVELRFPRPGPRTGTSFAEISRRAGGWGLAGACAVVRLDDGGRIERLALGLLGLAPTAVRAAAAERAATGREPDTAAVAEIAESAVADLDEIPADVHASASLRRGLGRVAVRRALTEAAARAAGA